MTCTISWTWEDLDTKTIHSGSITGFADSPPKVGEVFILHNEENEVLAGLPVWDTDVSGGTFTTPWGDFDLIIEAPPEEQN